MIRQEIRHLYLGVIHIKFSAQFQKRFQLSTRFQCLSVFLSFFLLLTVNNINENVCVLYRNFWVKLIESALPSRYV